MKKKPKSSYQSFSVMQKTEQKLTKEIKNFEFFV